MHAGQFAGYVPIRIAAGEFHSIVLAEKNDHMQSIATLINAQRHHLLRLKIIIESYGPLYIHSAQTERPPVGSGRSASSSNNSSPKRRGSFARSPSADIKPARRKSTASQIPVIPEAPLALPLDALESETRNLEDFLANYAKLYALQTRVFAKMDAIARAPRNTVDDAPFYLFHVLSDLQENMMIFVDIADAYIPVVSQFIELQKTDGILDGAVKLLKGRLLDEYPAFGEQTDPDSMSVLELLLDPFRQIAIYVNYIDEARAVFRQDQKNGGAPSAAAEAGLRISDILRPKLLGCLMRLLKNFNLTEPMDILHCSVDARGAPQLGSGSLRQLVERLTYASQSVDMEFTKAFFLTMRRFANPSKIVSILGELWEESRSAALQPGTRRQNQQSIMFTLHTWLQHPHCVRDWKGGKSEHSEHLSALLDKIATQDPSWQTTISVLKSFVKGERRRRTLRVSASFAGSSNFQQAFSIETSDDGSSSSRTIVEPKSAPVSMLELMHSFSGNLAEALAQEIAITDSEIFSLINHFEFVDKKPSNSEGVDLTPGISKMTQRFNRIALWTTLSVCDPTSSKERSAVFQLFVDIAAHLWTLCDQSGFAAVVTGLCNSAVSRLSRTMSKVSDKHKNKFGGYCEIISGANNYRMMRQTWAAASPPAVPFLALIMRDVTFIEDGNADTLENGGINFYKWRKLSGVIHDALQFQDAPFMFRRQFALSQTISRGITRAIDISEDGIYDISKLRE